MSQGLITDTILGGIADAIRSKLGVLTEYKPSQMAAAIAQIHGDPVLQVKNANVNGDVTPDSGYDGLSKVIVNVPNSYSASDEGKVVSSGALVAQTARSSQITANGTYDTTLNNSVEVNVSGGSPVIQSLSVLQNGTYTAPSGVDGYSPITVAVSGTTSQNDVLFHFESDFKNSGKHSAVFYNVKGLEISNEQSKFGNTSLKCGNSQTINNVAFEAPFNFGTDDFTLDFWCYPLNLPSNNNLVVPVSFAYRSLAIYMNQTRMQFGMAKLSDTWYSIPDIPISLSNGQWYHIAVVRDGGTVRCFVNGNVVNTVSFGASAFAPIGYLTIGSNTYDSGDRRFAGYIDELRLVLGSAVWTNDFTPPTQPYT